jgi:hypothetical protein
VSRVPLALDCNRESRNAAFATGVPPDIYVFHRYTWRRDFSTSKQRVFPANGLVREPHKSEGLGAMSELLNVYGPIGIQGVRTVCENSPSDEHETNGQPGLMDSVATVRQMLAARQHRTATGQWAADNVGAGGSLTRSAAFWEAIGETQARLVSSVTIDAAAGDQGETLRGLIDAYAEVRLMRESLWLTVLEQGGATTTKGRIRASYQAFMTAVATEERLAKTIGLQRREKRIPSAAELLRGDA